MLWIAITFLVLATTLSYLTKESRVKHVLFGIGWLLIGFHWINLPKYYFLKEDLFNGLLFIAGSFLAWALAFIEAKLLLEKKEIDIITYLGQAAAIATIIYFPLRNLSSFSSFSLEYIVAEHTFLLLKTIGAPISQNGSVLTFSAEESITKVSIVFACTGIESIALFYGAIIPSPDSLTNKVKALIATGPIIYILNLFRNTFVVYATGNKWFSAINFFGLEGSFVISHHVIAKAGSVIAIFLIAYFVLKILPGLRNIFFSIFELPKKIKEEELI
ncbi:MAG: Exosortase [Candidatus Methanohalarchaeum thermophilum]|uniref:Exosortase n=1 Tax=Methanohalarchaeum thermophilum TaxID=1903181 RepID=A0A1Q6DW57_METT1|nr:MAG: Exosortase [Candidatus Methanohalarchaeum thermophilum]